MSESASKPTEVYEDELDQLASSIRSELRQAGFPPAFDPLPPGVARAPVAAVRPKRRVYVMRMTLGYLMPALMVLGAAIVFRWLA